MVKRFLGDRKTLVHMADGKFMVVTEIKKHYGGSYYLRVAGAPNAEPIDLEVAALEDSSIVQRVYRDCRHRDDLSSSLQESSLLCVEDICSCVAQLQFELAHHELVVLAPGLGEATQHVPP